MSAASSLEIRIHTIHVRTRLPLARVVARAATAAGLSHSPGAAIALLVSDVASPTIAEEWMVDSVPHHVVTVRPGGVRVGPFVVPGTTPCLRCVQVTEAAEPAPLPARDSTAPSSTVTDGLAGLVVAGVGLAAADLAAYAGGDRPWGWARTITVAAAGQDTYVEEWPRHPHCGCAWGATG